jgi:hypothetical protein
MIDAAYKNRMWYYNLMKDFLDGKINAFTFMEEFLWQRHRDITEDKESGFSDYYRSQPWNESERVFMEYYSDKLYNHEPNEGIAKLLQEYAQGARKCGIKGWMFFSGIHGELFVDTRDFYPRNRKEAKIAGWDNSFIKLSEEEYAADYSIDETELRRRVLEKYNFLTENKDLWM